MSASLERLLNAAGVVAIAVVLALSFVFQLLWQELPCPLCLLQRIAFAAMAMGLVLNLRFGSRASHYGLVLLAAALGMAASGRQVLLHIVPGTGHYGSAILGLHFYTWAFLIFAAAVVLTSVMLLFDGPGRPVDEPRPALGRAGRVAVVAILALVLANAASTYLQCGFAQCPDTPAGYEVLDSWRGAIGTEGEAVSPGSDGAGGDGVGARDDATPETPPADTSAPVDSPESGSDAGPSEAPAPTADPTPSGGTEPAPAESVPQGADPQPAAPSSDAPAETPPPPGAGQ